MCLKCPGADGERNMIGTCGWVGVGVCWLVGWVCVCDMVDIGQNPE